MFRRQPLKNLKLYCLFKQGISLQISSRLSSTNFTWPFLNTLHHINSSFSLTNINEIKLTAEEKKSYNTLLIQKT